MKYELKVMETLVGKSYEISTFPCFPADAQILNAKYPNPFCGYSFLRVYV
jgi:hypothetical protein